jgi:DNA (cytosine-5)-methyltransferase 1
MDIQPNPMQPDYSGLRELALFAGAGGGLLASRQLGWRTVCAVEWDDYARNALVARQNHRSLEAFPIWDDVQTFDGRPWRGIVDVISGGFPCQDISAAGKGAGIDGERSGMWKHFARIIGEVRPPLCFIENSPMLVSRGLERVLCDLASMGYDVQWGCISAAEVGANHGRNRIWIVANTNEYASATPQRGIMGKEAVGQRSHGALHATTGHAGGASGHQRREAVLGLPQVAYE